jgi:hypothetical protein
MWRSPKHESEKVPIAFFMFQSEDGEGHRYFISFSSQRTLSHLVSVLKFHLRFVLLFVPLSDMV